ncbi:MAG TPA: zinc-binding dehydrogenase, partial [Planctomycetaceae bacterium]|nr:zinc-binding dehydrogenase [Planctomycetaceae bacterium]
CDLAGTVEAVGSDVKRFKPGDRVWGSNQSLMGRQGTFAELCAVGEEWLYPTPAEVTDEIAAASALVGITAQLGLFLHGGLQPGEVVFVNGGSGGVGSMVIQQAKAAGAKVITTAGSDEKLKFCRGVGADLALNYRSDSLDDEIRAFTEQNGGINIWFETQREPTLERTIGFMRKRGRIILMAGREARPEFPLGQFYVNDLQMLGFAMFNASPEEQRYAADDINRWLSEAKVSTLIGKQFPLSEAAAAHRLQEENTLGKSGTLSGKIVLTP